MKDRFRRITDYRLILLSGLGLVGQYRCRRGQAENRTQRRKGRGKCGHRLAAADHAGPGGGPDHHAGCETREQNGVTSNARKSALSRSGVRGPQQRRHSNATRQTSAPAAARSCSCAIYRALVLINGRRAALQPMPHQRKKLRRRQPDTGAAIDHIEVLTDGASSIYGSDPSRGRELHPEVDKQGLRSAGASALSRGLRERRPISAAEPRSAA